MHPNYLDLIDTKTSGTRYDVTPLFRDIMAVEELVNDLAQPFLGKSIDLVSGIDALGFILGTAMALHLQKGFIPIRKGEKLTTRVRNVNFVDYSGQLKRLEIRMDAILPGQEILLVDDWVETGSQISAAVQLIENLGGIVSGIAVINMDDNPNTHTLRERYFCHMISTNF